MSRVTCNAFRFVLVLGLSLLQVPVAPPQIVLPPQSVPQNFKEDRLFAARMRSILFPISREATGRYAIGADVMHRLLRQLPTGTSQYSWNVRIVKDVGNVFSSPDGTIFVDQQIADLLGTHSGLWAAALAHEIAHVIHRDWARRYLYQKSLKQNGSQTLVPGDPGSFASSWIDSGAISSRFAEFCQQMELDADERALILMAHAGFHPDFVAAMHHLIQSQPGQNDGSIVDPLHPLWEERDKKVRKTYQRAAEEFDRLWPERDESPGGYPPLVVYAGSVSARKNAGELNLQVPLHCENLVGSVEVILRVVGRPEISGREWRQFTGCTSDRTLVQFTLPENENPRSHEYQAELTVLDDNGQLVNRFFTTAVR